MSEIVDAFVCKVDDLAVKEKKVFRINDVPIVVYRKQENEFVAFGNKCSHYSAPLINGVICEDYVVCPWHAACFNIYTGEIEEYPGCNNIPVFNALVVKDDVYLRSSKDNFVSSVQKSIPIKKIDNKSTFLIIGGGPAGFQCAETLRYEGFNGKIVLITAEDAHPYDRTKLSKNLASKIDNLKLRNDEFYGEAQIEIRLNTICKKLDTEAHIAYFDDGSNLHFDKIFIATGSSPKKYHSSLENLTNVYYLRTYQNANDIHKEAENSNVVLIGSSFITIEIACGIVKTARSVTIISRSDVPFEKTLGTKIGGAIKKLLITKNVRFYVSETKLQFEIGNNRLNAIKSDSFEIPVDICIVGIGSYPNTDFLDNSPVNLNNSYITVNERFQTSVDDVFAGGDVVIYPNPLFNNKMMNISHWQTAQAHGRFAAFYMLNKPKPKYRSVPFFWSAVFGKGIRFAGIIENSNDCLIYGNLDELSFVAYYFDRQHKRVIGVATMSRDPLASAFAAMLRENKILTKQDVESNGNSWFENGFH